MNAVSLTEAATVATQAIKLVQDARKIIETVLQSPEFGQLKNQAKTRKPQVDRILGRNIL